MEQYIGSDQAVAPASTVGQVLADRAGGEYGAYIGLDVHKETIAVAVARPGRAVAEDWGEIRHTAKAIDKLVTRLNATFAEQVLLFCYEAGPCGYDLHRRLLGYGHHCEVVAPSLIPTRPGDRIKTDRRDARRLATSLRSGDLTAIWVPDHEAEAMRDLVRAREDFKHAQRRARQQLGAFVLRHGHHWPSNRSRWSRAHYRWLESLTFADERQQWVMDDYLEAVHAATQRVADLDRRLEQALAQWSLAPVVHALVALRGIDRLSAMVLLAELGDLRRFSSPRQLMGYLGLVPSEHSSGEHRRQGRITGTGNRRGRRILVESAWSYRFPARQTDHLARKAAAAPPEAQRIAWKAQKRLCGRYRRLLQSGKNTKQTTVSIARELAGFVWAIAQQTMPPANAQAS